MKFSLLTVLVLLFSFNTQAQPKNKGDLKPLHFQANKNNLEVLPQRFEYSFWDEDRLSVGDILIDATQVTFNLVPSKEKKGEYTIHFTWPAGLLKEGELTVKNNTGKAIYTAELTKENVKISRGTPLEGHEQLRSDIASFTAPSIGADVIDDMKYLPFMVFCIYRETDGTRLYLCSKELYISSQQGHIQVKQRSQSKKSAQIEINGAIVGNQGIIYLNDRSEAVKFQGRTQSGATLEIETRRNDVDFKDVIEDGDHLILTASGAEPADESQVKKISSGEWQITLPKDRPIVYLKGEGDIPMRQEFNIRGPLPQEQFRPYVGAKSLTKIYGSSMTLQVLSPEGVKIKPSPMEKTARLEPQGKGQYRWALTQIASGDERHYLNVEAGEHSFVAGYDTERGSPFALTLAGNYQAPSGLMSATLGLQWWMERFLFMSSNWSRLHWGLAVTQQQHLTDKADYAKIDTTTFELLWRAQPGFNMVDETWGLSLPIQMVKGESESATMFGLGAFWQRRPKSYFSERLMTWSEFKLQYFLGSSGSTFKVTSAYRLDAEAYKNFSPKSNWFLRYGAGLSQYKYDPAPAKDDMQFEVNAGLYWKF